MVDMTPSDEIREIIKAIHRFIENEVLPLEKRYSKLLEDERKMYDDNGYAVPELLELRNEIRKKSAKAGFYTMFVPQVLGGMGVGPSAAVFINESLGKTYGPGRILIGAGRGFLTSPIIASFVEGPSSLLLGLKDEVKKLHLDKLMSGEKTLCFALSEPEAGSDFWSMRTRAERKNNNMWVINGTKQWITNGPYADYAIIFAVTDDKLAKSHKGGISCFFVEKDRGWKVDSITPTMGHLGGDTATLSFENVQVPETNIIGEVNRGFDYAMLGIATGRLGIGGICVGLSQWALAQSVEYSKQRKTFGMPISEHQSIQFMLADSFIELYAARSMAIHCAWKVERGETPIKEISAVKAFCVETCQKIFDRAIQIHGAMGLVTEIRLQEGFRLARTLRIPDGTSEIQRRTIAKQLLKGNLEI